MVDSSGDSGDPSAVGCLTPDFLEWMEDTGGRIDEVDKAGERCARIARQIERPDENAIIRDAALALGQFRRRRMKDQPNPPGEWEGVLDDIRRALAMAISPEIAERRQRADEQGAKACEELAAFERRLWPEPPSRSGQRERRTNREVLVLHAMHPVEQD